MAEGSWTSCSEFQWFSRIRKAEADKGLYPKCVQITTLCKCLPTTLYLRPKEESHCSVVDLTLYRVVMEATTLLLKISRT